MDGEVMELCSKAELELVSGCAFVIGIRAFMYIWAVCLAHAGADVEAAGM